MTKHKIKTPHEALDIVSNWKNNGQEVVFTNGCFDIIHLGHVDYLEKARALGDRLVLGINTDASVSRLKGSARPVVGLASRERVMAAMAFIDLVVPFEEDTPKELIDLLMPDILVKGKDYNISNIVGADVVIEKGGKVATLELVEGYSTSAIISKIRNTKD